MCQPNPSKTSSSKTTNQQRGPPNSGQSSSSTIHFRNNTANTCHALPCNIQTTSNYANIAGYFQPTPLTEENKKRKVCNEDNKQDEKESDYQYQCAQFRGRSLMALDHIPKSNEDRLGIPLPSHIAGIVLQTDSNSRDGKLQVLGSFHNILEWQLADDVGKMEYIRKNKKSRRQKIQEWSDLSAAVSIFPVNILFWL